MNQKYLPIGSVVTIPSNGNKLMIIGYYSVEYQNVVKMYDYMGCIYPEGLLKKNTIISFNHSDIKSIVSLGYKDASYEILNRNFNKQQSTNQDDLETKDTFVNVKFDANGVVVYDEVSEVKQEPEILNINSISNPFNVEAVTAPIKDVTPASNSEFKFDENGFVIDELPVQNQVQEIESNFLYQFDENGNVIGETSLNNETQTEVNNVSYGFAPDGTVISESVTENEPVKEPAVAYQFDENGNVIGEQNLEVTASEEEQKPVYAFDENGFVVGE